MDKNRDERRVFSRHSGPNKKKPHLLIYGNGAKEKSSTVKNKRLSIVGSEMGFDGEGELHSSTVSPRKFKLPRKLFSDSNTSVPRKLRSAIKKRSRESASVLLPDSKRLNHRLNGVESVSKDCLQKSKIRTNTWSDHSPREAVSMAISKDEEEVAETLFALAGMIPLDGVHVISRTDNNSLEANTSDFSKKQHSNATPSSEDPVCSKEEQETVPSSTTDSSERDCLQDRSQIDPPPLIWSKLSERRQLNLNLKVAVPPGHFQTPPLLRACDDRQLTNSTLFCGSAEQNREIGLNETKPERRESHINTGAANSATSHDREPVTSTECRDNAWTSTRALHGSGVGRLPLQSSATALPSWLNNTSSSKPSSCDDTPSASKISCSINGGKKSWRRCVAHVYISRLIQVLQNSEGKDIMPLDTRQFRPSQTLSDGHAAGYWDDPNETLAADHMFGSSAYKNICETANDVPVLKNGQAEEEGHSLSECRDVRKQSYNFLSLSTGAGRTLDNSVNRLGITYLEARGHVFQMHSGVQSNTYVPSSLRQNYFPSLPYRDQVAGGPGAPPSLQPQMHIQVPPYISNHSGPSSLSSTRSTQQPHLKHQQQIWTAKLAAQFRPGPVLSSQVANWQNSRRNQYPHSMNQVQAPQASLEMTGSKYLHISQQPQQQLFGICPSLPTSSAKLQSSQLPSICEDKGGRFYSDGVLPLQLLCNERLLS